MKILLTGATGFVGKSVRKKLNDHTVLLTSRSEVSDSSNKFFQKTISSTEDFSECLDNVDVVIHTAARVHQMNDQSEDPLSEFMETNCFGTLNLAKQAADANVKRFIFISSIKVNGEKTKAGFPFKFDDPRQADDPYGKSKAEAELGLLKVADETKLEVTILRPPLIYGPGVKANFRALMMLASKNLPLPLGSIGNKRSFVAIDNLVDLIVTCINHPKAVNQVFLVSDDCDVSTSQLLSTMTEAFGKKARLISMKTTFLKVVAGAFGKRAIADRLCDDLQLDIEHTKTTLGWKPVISMTAGVRLCAFHISNDK